MQDHAVKDRQDMLGNTLDHKTARAKQYLGDRWVFHPARRISRLRVPAAARTEGSVVLKRGVRSG